MTDGESWSLSYVPCLTLKDNNNDDDDDCEQRLSTDIIRWFVHNSVCNINIGPTWINLIQNEQYRKLPIVQNRQVKSNDRGM